MNKRIIGIDVARAIALVGMIIVNFKVVFGDAGEGIMKSIATVFDGKAAATFVVLAGVGIALMTKSAVVSGDQTKLSKIKISILKKALFLFVVGLSYIFIWPADILHFYGIYMLVVLLFINQSASRMLMGVAAMIILFPILLVFVDYETGWNFQTLEYLDFWSIDGFVRNLFFNGFHPVIPWAAFMLFGLWYGRQDLHSSAFIKKSFVISLMVFVIIQAMSISMISSVSQNGAVDREIVSALFGVSPMPPMPFYMINGLAISIVVISACVWISRTLEHNIVINALHKTGKLALTFYVGHVILGMGLVEEFTDVPLGEFSITFSFVYAMIFSVACIVFANVWLRYFKVGPLEYVMRRLTNN